jgi:DNA-binding transcriptional ArsR family regulator
MTMDQALDAPDSALDERAASEAAASLFRAMGDPSRVAILRHLLLGEHNVRGLTEHLGLAQSTVSQHLACLRDCGLVDVRAVGRASLYRVSRPDHVLAVLAAAEQLLTATGDRVTLCPTQTGER